MYAKIENGLVAQVMGLPPYPWTDVPQAEQEYAGWFQVDTAARDAVNPQTHRVASEQVEIIDGRPVLSVTVEPRPAEEIQAEFQATLDLLWTQIKAERDRRRFNGGVKVGAHWFLSTEIATGEYNSIINLGLPSDYVLRSNWRTMDGAEVPMTPAMAKQILLAGFQQAAAIDDAAQAHKAAMMASPDPEKYDYRAGWPAGFGE